jgi:hypothetical protein
MTMKTAFLVAASIAVANAQTCMITTGGATIDATEIVKLTLTMMPSGTAFCDVCKGEGTVCTACFPATAEIELATGKKQLHAVTIGDKIHVGNGKFDDVYFFSSQMESTMSKFVSLSTADTDKALLLTSGHYLYVNGELKTAGSVKVGDMLTLGNGNKSKVTVVSSEWAPGLYNPHTLSGDIVVQGILTSTYTDLIDPTLAHALLLPLRQMYAAGAIMGSGFSAMAKGVPSWIRNAIA